MIGDDEPIDLEKQVFYLNGLIANEAPDREIEAEFAEQAIRYFGFARHELNGEVPRTVLSGFEEKWTFEDAMWLGWRHGYDFEDKGEAAKHPEDPYGYLIWSWMYFAEMLIAIECGFIPTDPAQISAIRMARAARKFEEVTRRDRDKPRQKAAEERLQIFGSDEPKKIEPGEIAAPKIKGKTTPPRTVKIEVLSRREIRKPPIGPRRP